VKDKDIKKEYKDGELNKLKKRIKRLESDKRRLLSELNTYEQAFKNTTKFLKDHTSDFSIEDLIEAAKNDKTLKETEEKKKKDTQCPVCLSEIKEMSYPAGSIILCTNNLCDYRETVNEEK